MQLSPTLTLLIILGYFVLLISISWWTSRQADTETFFTARRSSPWYLVAFGMIGATLSGVTFISIPGVVGAEGYNMNFSYMQMVLGYMVGYFVIATVLMPVYYRMNLVTIYGYLHKRFGIISYKTGAFYFLLSRVVGASFRLFLVAIILQTFVMNYFGISFYVTVAVTILLIWIYTFRGGIKTIVWTDTFQTTCLLTAVIATIIAISGALDLSIPQLWGEMKTAGYTKMFYMEGGWSDPNNFFKQFISGALIAIVMTGLDQDMMQKNLTCRSLPDAQKNMFLFSAVLLVAKFIFISLGAALYVYAAHQAIVIPDKTDLLYPTIALQHFSPFIGVVFVLGLIAAAYSSADSALTALTTSFCIDFMDFNQKDRSETDKRRIKRFVHIAFSVLLFFVIVAYKLINDDAIINQLFIWSGYTYGPLLGLFSFGLLTKRKIRDRWALLVCILAPILSYVINANADLWLGGFQFGFMIVALNGFLTFVGLWLISFNRSMHNE